MHEHSKNENLLSEAGKEKFNFPEIAELENPMQNLLDQMRPKIDSGDYSIVLGEDASGRIPTLAIGEALSEIYKKRNKKPPETRFFASEDDWVKTSDYIDRLRAYVEKLKPDPDKKILVCTESVQTGGTINPLLDLLLERGVKFDLAIVIFMIQ